MQDLCVLNNATKNVTDYFKNRDLIEEKLKAWWIHTMDLWEYVRVASLDGLETTVVNLPEVELERTALFVPSTLDLLENVTNAWKDGLEWNAIMSCQATHTTFPVFIKLNTPSWCNSICFVTSALFTHNGTISFPSTNRRGKAGFLTSPKTKNINHGDSFFFFTSCQATHTISPVFIKLNAPLWCYSICFVTSALFTHNGAISFPLIMGKNKGLKQLFFLKYTCIHFISLVHNLLCTGIKTCYLLLEYFWNTCLHYITKFITFITVNPLQTEANIISCKEFQHYITSRYHKLVSCITITIVFNTQTGISFKSKVRPKSSFSDFTIESQIKEITETSEQLT